MHARHRRLVADLACTNVTWSHQQRNRGFAQFTTNRRISPTRELPTMSCWGAYGRRRRPKLESLAGSCDRLSSLYPVRKMTHDSKFRCDNSHVTNHAHSAERSALCSLGVIAAVGVSTLLYQASTPWWLAGIAGAAMGAVWNCVSSSAITWPRP
jgi:hypothetical protein